MTRPRLDDRAPLPERWVPVVGYEGLYEVSDLGRVRSVDRVIRTHRGHLQGATGTILKPWPLKGTMPYLAVGLCKKGRRTNKAIHRLVLSAFRGPRPEGMVGCHNDGDHTNNALSNLRWDTFRSNNLDTVRHGAHPGANKTHCPAGHPYSGDNLRMYRNGGIPRRRCHTCHEENRRKSRARAAALKGEAA